MADSLDNSGNSFDATSVSQTFDGLRTRTDGLTVSANSFANAMTRAFVQATVGGKQLDDVFRSLALRISSLAVAQSFAPVSSGIASGINGLLSGLFSSGGGQSLNLTAAMGAIKPFASGGVIGTPTFFPLASGGVGLAGEAGPEAIIPLSRGPDGQLGVSAQGAGRAANVTIQITTPDADSFRRSESYITGQIARAVARGQRSL